MIGEGTSSIPCSEIYHGPNAFSEPETRAIRDLITSKGRRVKAFFDIHSYSQYWLIPWGFTKDSPVDYQDMVIKLSNLLSLTIYNQGSIFSTVSTGFHRC